MVIVIYMSLIKTPTKTALKTLKSFWTGYVKVVKLGYGIRRTSASDNNIRVPFEIINQIISVTKLKMDHYLHLIKQPQDGEPVSLFWHYEILIYSIPLPKYLQEIEIEVPLGNPVIADLVDHNYYSGLHVIACSMCELNTTHSLIQKISLQLFFLGWEVSIYILLVM